MKWGGLKNVEIWYNLFNIYSLKNQFIEDWEKLILKKKIKIDFKKLEGEGDQSIFILII